MLSQDPVNNFITSLHVVHQENSAAQHYARVNGSENSTMYLTPFVYQFFIYNSLYQINWNESFRTGSLVPFEERDEPTKQKVFESFLAERVTCAALVSSFREMPRLKGDEKWTQVVPDAIIVAERGKKFFADLGAFQSRLRRMKKSNTPSLLGEALRYIPELRGFVYDVRCNIFHGRKSLAQAMEYGQNNRIEVYFKFLKGLVTLFFNVVRPAPPEDQ